MIFAQFSDGEMQVYYLFLALYPGKLMHPIFFRQLFLTFRLGVFVAVISFKLLYLRILIILDLSIVSI